MRSEDSMSIMTSLATRPVLRPATFPRARCGLRRLIAPILYALLSWGDGPSFLLVSSSTTTTTVTPFNDNDMSSLSIVNSSVVILCPIAIACSSSSSSSTTSSDAVLNATIEYATALSASRTRRVRVEPIIYGSCGVGAGDLLNLASALFAATSEGTETSPAVSAIVGPASDFFCDVIGKLGSQENVPIFSYLCFEITLPSSRSDFSTFAMTGPTNVASVTALGAVLLHFQWKYSAVFTSDDALNLNLADQVNLVLSAEGQFDVVLNRHVDTGLSVENATVLLQQIDRTVVKAIIFILPADDVKTFLLASVHTKLASGSFGFILIDTLSPLNASTNNTMNPPFDWTGDEFYNQSLGVAMESFMILKAHAQSIIIDEQNISYKYSLYSEYLYNAIALTYATLDASVNSNVLLNDGRQVALAAADLTFDALHGNATTTSEGSLPLYFTLWAFSPGAGGLFVPTIEAFNGSWTVTLNERYPALWVIGPPPDTCLFTNCGNEATIRVIAGVVVSLVVFVVAASVLTFIVRRRIAYKELTRGPHKILIGLDDLTFVSSNVNLSMSKASLSAKSLRDGGRGSNARKGSDMHSLVSLRDANARSKMARYNGDLVFVKELMIRGFEIHGKVQNYLKSLRDLRHENINPFIGCYTDPTHPALIFEFCTRRSLTDVIDNNDIKLDWEFKLSLLTDLVSGMRYLHSSVIRCHGGLKSSNCVIDSRWVLKLTDFGMKGIYDRYKSDKLIFKPTELLWTAPELLRSEELFDKGTQKGDVYSFSIVTQELILRCRPFSMLDREPEEIIQKLRKPPPLCRPSVSPGAAPPEFIQLMKQCWAELPDMRPDFEDIVQRFKSINKGRRVNIVDTMFKMLEKYSNDLEETVRVRTVALEDERKKVENLLSQMLPVSVAQALLTGKAVDPEWYDDVTIYFSDIVGFTTISAMSTPLQVVKLLNDLYTTFDSTIDYYDVYKVETIGDAYMVCSGLPTRNADHAGQISTLALDILSECGRFKIHHMPDLPLRIRIGLHSGSCVAGVVGLRMPRYCLFGDTVNTASRMESTGSAFRIHVSQSTKEHLDRLQGGYQVHFRGETELKGKGIHKTYWLVGKTGFTKPLPEPPAQTGEDNHGLGAYVKALAPSEPPPQTGQSDLIIESVESIVDLTSNHQTSNQTSEPNHVANHKTNHVQAGKSPQLAVKAT